MLEIKDRIKTARISEGLSLQDLADKINNVISRQALYRYEKGEVIPNNEILELIAKATNRPTNFFNKTTEIKIEIGKINYHKIKW
jgi:transcriptional regulator with XRE-family HTH domain